MSAPGFAKCVCTQCGTHLEFPLELNGTAIDCPHCRAQTLLAPEEGSLATAAEEPLPQWTILDVQQAFVDEIRWPWTSPLYGFALVLVSAVMVLLPVIYLGLVGLASYGVYLWADHGRFLFGGPRGGVYGLVIRATLYIAPLIAGVITVFFMIKPLLARPGRRAQPLALNPVTEPVLYTFVQEIARQVGSPMPARIDLDCQLNAAAGFRRGLASVLSGDLVLTLGLPLVAGLTARELAGVIAHELGHFRQGVAMRMSYLVRNVNGWFARVIYERDAWDERLSEWAVESEGLISSIVVLCAAVAVWFTRALLTLLLLLGHAISTLLLRQMEFDADRCQIRLAGSAAFESTIRRLNVLGKVQRDIYEELRMRWNRDHQLPVSLPAHLNLREQQLPAAQRERIENTLGLRRSAWYESHPSDAERIRRARIENASGVISLEGPASALFSCFEVPARHVTSLHYTDDLRLPIVPAALV
jgi:Zn-dependent protease with chaperone function